MAHILVSNLNHKDLKQSNALEEGNYCEQLYEIEKELREQYIGIYDYYDDRHTIRLKKFQEYVDTEIFNAITKSILGKVITYDQKLLPYM